MTMNDLAPFLPKFAAAYSILLFAALSPGPAVAFLLGIGTARGRGAAMAATAGIATGSLTTNILTLLGVGAILSQAAWAMTIFKLVGAAYLIWLAWGAFRRAMSPAPAPVVTARADRRAFLAGFLMQASNPKSIAFWLAIASIGATQGGGPLVIAAFCAGSFAISFACHGIWALALSSAPMRALHHRFRRRVDAVLGVFFGFAAWKLATAER